MFKTDKESLEKMSFGLDERDVANFGAVLKYLGSNGLLTVPNDELQRALKGLEAIGKLKLDGKVYGFHVSDSCVAKQYGNTEGVELYLRQGDALREFFAPFSRDFAYSPEDAAKFLKKQKRLEAYTGEIPPAGLLGLKREQDPEDPIIYSALIDYDIKEFERG